MHIQLHIYGFSRTVNLFCSSQNMETYLGGEELRFESRFIMFRQNSSNLHVRKLKWHGCINKYFFISVFHLLTLSGRFRVGFGVGHISNTIEHSFLGTDPGYFNSEPLQTFLYQCNKNKAICTYIYVIKTCQVSHI